MYSLRKLQRGGSRLQISSRADADGPEPIVCQPQHTSCHIFGYDRNMIIAERYITYIMYFNIMFFLGLSLTEIIHGYVFQGYGFVLGLSLA